MKITFDDLQDMARTVWGEARGQGQDGMRAVAHVILNRVKDRRWPDRIGAVCKQKWQFSCWNENDPNRVKLLTAEPTRESFRAAIRACLDAIDGEDITRGADHYFADSIKAPMWALEMEQVAAIGHHLFFKG